MSDLIKNQADSKSNLTELHLKAEEISKHLNGLSVSQICFIFRIIEQRLNSKSFFNADLSLFE